MKYISDNLKNFNDTVNAFTKFKNGGYWIKKIDKKGLDIIEIVNGPYNKKRAEELSENYISKHRIKNIDVFSKVYSFKELLVSSSLFDNQHSTLVDSEEENIWKPPEGIFIFAIAHNIFNIAVYKKEDLQTDDFIKFVKYGNVNNVVYLTVKNYLIFYNNRKTESYIKAKKLYKLINENPEISEENLDKIIKIYTQSDNFQDISVIPEYMRRYIKNCELLTLSFFKKYSKDKNPLKNIFNHLKECLNNDSIFSQSLDDNTIEISIEVDLIYTDNDYKPKKIYFIHNNGNDEYSFELGNYGGDYSIRLKGNEIIINLPENREKWNKFMFTNLGSDTKLSNMEKLLSLFLYICKSVKKEKLIINDTRIVSCKYEKNNLPIYINIIRELANYDNVYHSLGGVRKNQAEFLQKLNKYRNIQLKDLIQNDIISQELSDKTLTEISKNFVEGFYKYKEICLVMSIVSKLIYEKTKECCSQFNINLKNNNYEFYRKHFM